MFGVGYIERAKEVFLEGIKNTKKYEHINSCYLYTALGNMAKDLKLYNEAKDWYMKGLKTKKGYKSDSLHSSLGLLEEFLGNYEEAAQLYERCLSINKRARYIHLQYATLLWKRLKDYKRAR